MRNELTVTHSLNDNRRYKTMKMTVKEAFEKCSNIVINYVFETRCRECGKYYDETDEEYSFEGDKEYFLGD